MLLVPATAALLYPQSERTAPLPPAKVGWTPHWFALAAVFALVIGYRDSVGGDWAAYLDHFDFVAGASLGEVIMLSDPGHYLLNWFSGELGAGIFGVNLVSGAIFMTGVVLFCRSLPRPWLAMAAAVPYLIIVVGMGYTRQSVALGFALLGLLALRRQDLVRFTIWILVGAAFHKTAVVLLPIAVLAKTRNRYWTIVWIALVSAAGYLLFLQDTLETMYASYIEAEYQSEGALVRLAMNALPAALLLLGWKRFRLHPGEARLWAWCAVISLALLATFYLSPASTALDRLALYMLPLQLVVFTHLPDTVGRQRSMQLACVAIIVFYYAAVQFIWLNYAKNAEFWLPYRFFPFEQYL